MDDLVYYLGEVLDELDVILRLSPTPKKIRYGYTDRTFDIIYFIDLKNIMENIRDKKIDTILN
jgi:hypothetical protein